MSLWRELNEEIRVKVNSYRPLLKAIIRVVLRITIEFSLIFISDYFGLNTNTKMHSNLFDWTIPGKLLKYIFISFLSEEERAHFSDLYITWKKSYTNRYQVQWKVFDHLVLQRLVVAPISRLWSVCSRTVRRLFEA